MNTIGYKWEATNWVGFTFTLEHPAQPQQVWEVVDDKNPAPNSSNTPRYECKLREQNYLPVEDGETRLFTQHALMGHYICQLEQQIQTDEEELAALEVSIDVLENELEECQNGDF